MYQIYQSIVEKAALIHTPTFYVQAYPFLCPLVRLIF